MAKRGTVLVLGGAGYIGSHACLELKKNGYMPVIIDNLFNGHRALCQAYQFENADILDTEKLTSLFNQYKPVAVMHFAAFIEVTDSVENPEKFYENNVEGTRSVLWAMQECGIKNIVFSSTAAVYGQPDTNEPIKECCPISPINPYGETKAQAEADIKGTAGIRSVCLRYFNAAGADASGKIGEAHFPETHLVPLTLHAALGLRDNISIFGQEYPTKDGTCVRDYIHVSDLARAHVKALEYLLNGGASMVCNLGTGKGYSVKDIIETAQRVVDEDIKVIEAPARAGDPAFLVADNTKAKKVLDWSPETDLEEIIRSAYGWHKSDLYKRLYQG